jgi:hypothetical protein
LKTTSLTATRSAGPLGEQFATELIMKQLWAIAVVLTTITGCGNSNRLSEIDTSAVRLPESLESVLNTAYTVELLSISPVEPWQRDEIPPDNLYGWEVLGRAQLDEESASKIVHGLKAGIATAPDHVASCFWPRHGLRFSADKHTVDLLICFECLQIKVFDDGEEVDSLGTSEVPLKLFDQVVRENNLRMPPPAG